MKREFKCLDRQNPQKLHLHSRTIKTFGFSCSSKMSLVYGVFNYPAEEEVERKATIRSTSLDASHDAIETSNVNFQPVQVGVVTQTGNRKRGKNVDILPTPSKVITNDATDISTPVDVDNFFSFSQQVSIVVQQPAGPSSSLF